MEQITPQSIYIIVPAIKPRTNEFTLEDQKGNVLSYLERKENMYCFTREELEKFIGEAFEAGENGYYQKREAGSGYYVGKFKGSKEAYTKSLLK